jgi:hypothetical protein
MSLGIAEILNKFYPVESGQGFTTGAVQVKYHFSTVSF